MATSFTREQWFERVFPSGVPRLWCPPLTHYNETGNIDERRMEAHWRFLAPWVKGVLIPGSTGDGWELTEPESAKLLDLALAFAAMLDIRVLIGALRPTGDGTCLAIRSTAERLGYKPRSGSADQWLTSRSVCGFAICPPRGAELNQAAIQAELTRAFEIGLPLALYQLPQVTLNEMSPELLTSLAQRYPHFLLFKDTSGTDKVALSGQDLAGVFMVRGMEGDYHRWLKTAGGPYNGFLLSAANSFAPQLDQMIELTEQGRQSEAQSLSDRIAAVVSGTFDLVRSVPDGNVFSNGGKAIDHFHAHGPRAELQASPRLYSGQSLPVELIRKCGELLTRHGLMPKQGYLE